MLFAYLRNLSNVSSLLRERSGPCQQLQNARVAIISSSTDAAAAASIAITTTSMDFFVMEVLYFTFYVI